MPHRKPKGRQAVALAEILGQDQANTGPRGTLWFLCGCLSNRIRPMFRALMLRTRPAGSRVLFLLKLILLSQCERIIRRRHAMFFRPGQFFGGRHATAATPTSVGT